MILYFLRTPLIVCHGLLFIVWKEKIYCPNGMICAKEWKLVWPGLASSLCCTPGLGGEKEVVSVFVLHHLGRAGALVRVKESAFFMIVDLIVLVPS